MAGDADGRRVNSRKLTGYNTIYAKKRIQKPNPNYSSPEAKGKGRRKLSTPFPSSNLTRPPVRHAVEVRLEPPRLPRIDLLDVKVAEQRRYDLGDFKVREMPAGTLVVACTPL